MLASNRGVGFLIMNSSAQFNTAGMFAGLVVLMVLASLLNGAVGIAEKRLLRWKVTRS
jgi:NitT/TauT family transport system permease protein